MKYILGIELFEQYELLLKSQLEELEGFGGIFRMVENEEAAIAGKYYKGGAISWPIDGKEKEVEIQINIDAKNLSGWAFLFVFLHEFGHLKDKDNKDIKRKTMRSEVSAWKHALYDLKDGERFKRMENRFWEVMTFYLKSYDPDVFITSTKELETIDLMKFDNEKVLS